MRTTGVTSRGIICPIFQQGDDLAGEIVKSLLAARDNDGFEFNDGDIVGVTEAVVGRTQGNYATTAQIYDGVQTLGEFGASICGFVFTHSSASVSSSRYGYGYGYGSYGSKYGADKEQFKKN